MGVASPYSTCHRSRKVKSGQKVVMNGPHSCCLVPLLKAGADLPCQCLHVEEMWDKNSQQEHGSALTSACKTLVVAQSRLSLLDFLKGSFKKKGFTVNV